MQADPVEIQLAQLPEQRRQLPLAIQVDAIAGNVLGDDDALLHAGTRQLPGLGQHVLHSAAAVAPPEGRDDAVGAVVIAALGDTQISVMLGGGQHPVELVDLAVDAGKAAGVAAAHQLLQRRHDLAVAAGAHDTVHLRQLRQDLLPVALGEAAGDQNFPHLPLRLQLCRGKDGVDGLLLGAVDKAAGVDDHHVRPGRLLQQDMPGVAAQCHHLLGVHQILGTAKGNKGYFHVRHLMFRRSLAPAR